MRGVLITVFIAMSAVAALACGSDGVDVPSVATQIEPTATDAPPVSVAPTASEKVEAVVKETEPIATEASTSTETPVAEMAPERDLDIVTLLPFDGIRSIDSPNFFPDLEKANMFYKDHELVLGVEIDGDARAYSVPLLSSHEIVNDVVGGRPIAVTW